MDSQTVEWIFANWQDVGIGGIVLALLYSYRRKLLSFVGSGTSTTAKTPDDVMGAHVVNLFAIRGLLSQAGNVEAVAAIDGLVLPGLGKAPDAIKALQDKEAADAAAKKTA